MQSPADAALVASALTKRFGSRTAVAGVDFVLSAGGCLALFGPNGAGKTTLLRLVAGLLRPSAGTIRVGGLDARGEATVRSRVGLVSHHTMLYAPLTALENLVFFARLHGVVDASEAAMRALESMRVADRAHTQVRTLSRGLQQRVALARALVHEPRLLLLDEPWSGLDESGAAALTEVLSTLRSRGATLIVVTHNVGEGLALATHAAIMHGGRFARFDTRESADFEPQRYVAAYRELVRHA